MALIERICQNIQCPQFARINRFVDSITMCPFCGTPYTQEAEDGEAFWQRLCDDQSLWYWEAFDSFPAVIAHEYKRLYDACSRRKPYCVLLEIKDTLETVIKFESLVCCAYAHHASLPAFTDQVACSITDANPSLSSWERFAQLIHRYYIQHNNSKPAYLVNTLGKIITAYHDMGIVAWRNQMIGHGALGFSDDPAFRSNLQEKLMQIASLFAQIAPDMQQHIIKQDSHILMGHSAARRISDKAITCTGGSDGYTFVLDPYIVPIKNGQFFYDSLRSSRKTRRLCYTDGRIRDERNPFFAELHRIRQSNRMATDLAVDADDMTLNEELLLNRIHDDDSLVTPTHLINWVRAQIDSHPRGIYAIRMPRGTGKSTFTEMLNRRYARPIELTPDIDVRTYHISRTQLRSDRDFVRATELMWQMCHQGDGEPRADYTRIDEYIAKGHTPAQAFAAFLGDTRRFTELRRGRSKLLMIIDGLDEIVNDSLWKMLPDESQLSDGVHILLVSRDPDQEDLPPAFTQKLISLKINAKLSIRLDGEENMQFLREFLTKNCKVKLPCSAETLARMSGYRVLYLSMYAALLNEGLRSDQLPSGESIVKAYISQLVQSYNERNGVQMMDMLAVISAKGAAGGFTLKELARLCGSGQVTFQMLGMINDLAPLLKAERGYEADGYMRTGETRLRIVNDDLAAAVFRQLPNGDQAIRRVIEEALDTICEEAEKKKKGISEEPLLITECMADMLRCGGMEADTSQLLDGKWTAMNTYLTWCFRGADHALTYNRIGSSHEQMLLLDEMAGSRMTPSEKAALYENMAFLAFEYGQNDRALTMLDKSLNLLASCADAGRIMGLNRSRARALVQLKRLDEARDILSACCDYYIQRYHDKDVQSAQHAADCYDRMARIAEMQGQFEKAIELRKATIDLLEQLEDTPFMLARFHAAEYADLSSVLVKLNRMDEASAVCQKSIKMLEDYATRKILNHPVAIATACEQMAYICSSKDEKEASCSWWERAVNVREVCEAEGRRQDVCARMRSYLGAGRAQAACGRYENALARYHIAQDIGQTQGRGRSDVKDLLEETIHEILALNEHSSN